MPASRAHDGGGTELSSVVSCCLSALTGKAALMAAPALSLHTPNDGALLLWRTQVSSTPPSCLSPASPSVQSPSSQTWSSLSRGLTSEARASAPSPHPYQWTGVPGSGALAPCRLISPLAWGLPRMWGTFVPSQSSPRGAGFIPIPSFLALFSSFFLLSDPVTWRVSCHFRSLRFSAGVP